MKQTCLALALVLMLPTAAAAGWKYQSGVSFESQDDAFALKIRNQVQLRLTVNNPDLGDNSASFDISRAKLRFEGKAFRDWDFALQANWTDSDTSSRVLEDAYFVYGARPLARLWVGQGKVQFGRQDLTPSWALQFAERSLVSEEFRHLDSGADSRDVGIALLGGNREKTYHYSVGVYNGNGINKDEDDNTDYMVAGRLVVTPFGELALEETDLSRPETSKLAVGISARTLTEGTEAINEERRDSTAAIEVSYRIHGLNLHGEFFTKSADPPLGVPGTEEDTDGWNLQGGWLFNNDVELVARYGEVIREDAVNDDETELALGLNYYIAGHDCKVQADYRKLEFEGIPATPDIDSDQFRVQFQLVF